MITCDFAQTLEKTMVRNCNTCEDDECANRDKPCAECGNFFDPCENNDCIGCDKLITARSRKGIEHICTRDTKERYKMIDDPLEEQTKCQTCKYSERCFRCADGDDQWEAKDEVGKTISGDAIYHAGFYTDKLWAKSCRIGVIPDAFVDGKLVQTYHVNEDDQVNHPSHYTQGKIEVCDFIVDQQMDFCRGNAIKYISRAPYKGSHIQDIDKAIWYLNRYKQQLESGGAED